MNSPSCASAVTPRGTSSAAGLRQSPALTHVPRWLHHPVPWHRCCSGCRPGLCGSVRAHAAPDIGFPALPRLLPALEIFQAWSRASSEFLFCKRAKSAQCCQARRPREPSAGLPGSSSRNVCPSFCCRPLPWLHTAGPCPRQLCLRGKCFITGSVSLSEILAGGLQTLRSS